MKKNLFRLMALMMVAMLTIGFTSCSKDDDDDNSASIVGTWVDAQDYVWGTKTMILGSNGSYSSTTKDSYGTQYRNGTYSYNPTQGTMVINVKAGAYNGAYQQTYIVQTLTAKNLVLMDTDGDIEGYYTRK